MRTKTDSFSISLLGFAPGEFFAFGGPSCGRILPTRDFRTELVAATKRLEGLLELPLLLQRKAQIQPGHGVVQWQRQPMTRTTEQVVAHYKSVIPHLTHTKNWNYSAPESPDYERHRSQVLQLAERYRPGADSGGASRQTAPATEPTNGATPGT